MLELSQLHTATFDWWKKNGRVLPWREKLDGETPVISEHPKTSPSLREAAFESYFATSLQRDPYRVVVAELMLQQTQVDRVLPKFEAWMNKWPTTAALGQASLAEILIFWQGLGYNRRAKFLWKLSQQIEERGGVWPTTEAELLELPGIGKYTARAVMSFAMGLQVGVVDTNIRRVIARIEGLEWSEKQVEPAMDLKADYFKLADEILPKGQADPWNQAIMDLGAMVCTAKIPHCEVCPLNEICVSNLRARAHDWTSYGEWLLAREKMKKAALKKKHIEAGTTPIKKIRFEDTDRFFRGRVMDVLREADYELPELSEKMENEYGLVDHKRFQKVIAGLVAEELISVHEKTVRLG